MCRGSTRRTVSRGWPATEVVSKTPAPVLQHAGRRRRAHRLGPGRGDRAPAPSGMRPHGPGVAGSIGAHGSSATRSRPCRERHSAGLGSSGLGAKCSRPAGANARPSSFGIGRRAAGADAEATNGHRGSPRDQGGGSTSRSHFSRRMRMAPHRVFEAAAPHASGSLSARSESNISARLVEELCVLRGALMRCMAAGERNDLTKEI